MTRFCLCVFLVSSVGLRAGELGVAARKLEHVIAHRGASAERPENTLAALRRAIEVGATAVEVDVQMSRDAGLVLLHDLTVDRTTNGSGAVGDLTLAQIRALDAGAWLDDEFRGEPVPTLGEALALCSGKCRVLLDLKGSGEVFVAAVGAVVRRHGRPGDVIVGVHDVEQARRFRAELPDVVQLGFVLDPSGVDALGDAGVEAIRLWDGWLPDRRLLDTVKSMGVKLQLNVLEATPARLARMLACGPDWILVDDPAAVLKTLAAFRAGREPAPGSLGPLDGLVSVVGTSAPTAPEVSVSRRGALSFLNRPYRMRQLPEEVVGLPRIVLAGGEGSGIRCRFKRDAVVLAVFEYNRRDWRFADHRSPERHGWHVYGNGRYRGSSNGTRDGKPHHATIFFRQYAAGEELAGLPRWWLCLGVVDLESASTLAGFTPGLEQPDPEFSYLQWATRRRGLLGHPRADTAEFSVWQATRRRDFIDRLVFRHGGGIDVAAVGEPVDRGAFLQREFVVRGPQAQGNARLFRFFRLEPRSLQKGRPAPAIVCFMGHGQVRQVLSEQDSYQHACAARLAGAGYLVYAMENVGMEPEGDRHLELDRILRLDGFCWYSLLFAHQRILLDHVFAEEMVDAGRVGVTGVSTGGLLALSAAAIDTRVSCASVQGIFGSMRVSFIDDRDRHCRCGAIPGLLPGFDLPDLAVLVAPRPLHVSNPTRDGFGPREAKRAVDLVNPVFVEAGGEALLFTSAEGRHEFVLKDALEFFRDRL